MSRLDAAAVSGAFFFCLLRRGARALRLVVCLARPRTCVRRGGKLAPEPVEHALAHVPCALAGSPGGVGCIPWRIRNAPRGLLDMPHGILSRASSSRTDAGEERRAPVRLPGPPALRPSL